MREKAIVLGCALGMVLSCSAFAEGENGYHLTADMTWASQYITDGFDVGGDHPVMQPTLQLDTPLRWLGFAYWSSLQIDRGNSTFDEHDVMVKPSIEIFEKKRYAIDLYGYAAYWVYPNKDVKSDKNGRPMSSRHFDGQKYNMGVSLPNLLPVGGSSVIPSYSYYYWNPMESKVFAAGGRHELRVQYNHAIPAFIPGTSEPNAGLYGLVNYHEGAFDVEPGWSHSAAGLSTALKCDEYSISLGVHYQWSYEDSVNDEDEIWQTISIARTF